MKNVLYTLTIISIILIGCSKSKEIVAPILPTQETPRMIFKVMATNNGIVGGGSTSYNKLNTDGSLSTELQSVTTLDTDLSLANTRSYEYPVNQPAKGTIVQLKGNKMITNSNSMVASIEYNGKLLISKEFIVDKSGRAAFDISYIF